MRLSDMRKLAIIMSGCGGMDGTECHEAMCLMLAIRRAGLDYMCFAIDENQKYVIHCNKMQQSGEKRNMLDEAGRLNHANIHDIKKLSVNKFDGLVFPGGYGTGTSFSNFIVCNGSSCTKNNDYTVRDEIKSLIQAFHEHGKPIFAGCMAGILVNGSLTGIKVMTDVGKYTEEAIEKRKNTYQVCNAGEICVDEENKIVTAPYYMTPKVGIETIFDESEKGIAAMIKMFN